MIHFLLDFYFLFFNFHPLRIICEFSITWLEYRRKLNLLFEVVRSIISVGFHRADDGKDTFFMGIRKKYHLVVVKNQTVPQQISPMRINRKPWIRCLWNLGKKLDGVDGCRCGSIMGTRYIVYWIRNTNRFSALTSFIKGNPNSIKKIGCSKD